MRSYISTASLNEDEMCLITAVVLFHSLQETSVKSTNDGAPGTPHPAAPPDQHSQSNTDQGRQNDPVTSSPAESWVTSTGQLLKRER